MSAAGRSVKVVTPSCPLAFGDELIVVGSHQGWVPEAGTVLTWTEGDTWVGQLPEPLSDPGLEFKVPLMRDCDTAAREGWDAIIHACKCVLWWGYCS